MSDTSAFLRLLAHLDADTVTEVLLARLLPQGSAPQLALTCRQLRSLCQRGCLALDFSNMPSTVSSSTILQHTEGLHTRFPSCETVKLSVADRDSCGVAACLLPSLAQ